MIATFTAPSFSASSASGHVSLGPFLFPILFVGVVAFIIFFHLKRRKGFTSLPTLQEYLQRHPEAKLERGGVKCIHCGSTNLYLDFYAGPQQTTGLKRHLCRGCGTALYHSK